MSDITEEHVRLIAKTAINEFWNSPEMAPIKLQLRINGCHRIETTGDHAIYYDADGRRIATMTYSDDGTTFRQSVTEHD
jgi:hypothetical protein